MGEEWLSQFPLRASGAHVVNRHGERFKFAGVNWYGASDSLHVVAGLDMRPLDEICRHVAEMGFSVVRLPFSNQMLREKSVPEGAINYELNGALRGKSPVEVYDATVDALGAAGVAVVLNNHTTIGMWSGGVEANGLWFLQGSDEYTEARWIEDWLAVAERYRQRPHCVAWDLRNEVRPVAVLSSSGSPNWNEGGERDWCAAAGRCSRALCSALGEEGPMIIVERLCWPQNSLREMLLPKAPWDLWNVPRERIMLSLHSYSWSGPGFWSPKAFVGSGVTWAAFQAYDSMMSRSLYGELEEGPLAQHMDAEWGFCLEEGLCPVWLSEFGGDACSERDCRWFSAVCRYLQKKDADWAYWPLNVGKKPGGEGDESYGLLTNDWRPRWSDERLRALRRLMPRGAQRRRTSSTTSLGSAPWSFHESDERLLGAPLAMLPRPWCAPLPGPLLPWPGEAPPGPKQLPPCKYLWTNIQGSDADPGQDARVETFSGNLQSLKQLCIQEGYGGFALHNDKAYMRKAPGEELLRRTKGGYPKTILWLAEEVRLCGRWTGACVAPEEGEEAAEFQEECRRQCIAHEHVGFELDSSRQGWARMLPPDRPMPNDTDGAGRQLLERVPVKVTLEALPGKDAFPGSNAQVLRSPTFAQCRVLCLSGGFGGFALYQGDAFFRTANADVLKQHLVPAQDTTFYILRVEEQPASLLASLWTPFPLLPGRPVALETCLLPRHCLNAADSGEPGKGKVCATKTNSPKEVIWAQWRLIERQDGKVNLESLKWPRHYLEAGESFMGRREAFVTYGHPDDPWAKWNILQLPDGTMALESSRWEGHFLSLVQSNQSVVVSRGVPEQLDQSSMWKVVPL